MSENSKKHDPLLRKEYCGVTQIAGPLLFVESADDIPYGAIVTIRTDAGKSLNGQIIEVSDKYSVIQVFEQTLGLDVVKIGRAHV